MKRSFFFLTLLVFLFNLPKGFALSPDSDPLTNPDDPLLKTVPSLRDTSLNIQNKDDQTLSPYFFVKSEDPAVDQLPLLSTSARVSIAGVIADVVVHQVYKNSGRSPIEALYVFPASTRAAVYAMKMTIGERTIQARIKEREAARKAYEQAKSEGKTASLLEQQRPNVFQMNVANIMPGDSIVVEMKYTELLVPTEAIYEFVYPTVVGPRYSNKKASKAKDDKWVANSYFKEGENSQTTFDISVDIASGVPIQDVACLSHKTAINYDGKRDATINLDKSEINGGNRDYILRYRLAGNKIESGLMLYEGKDENFFLAMVQPPSRITQSMIPNREYLYVIDISGSMRGQPLDVSKSMMSSLLSKLRPTETFNILMFSGGSKVFSEKPMTATKENIQKGLDFVSNARGGGGTQLVRALKRAMALPKAEKGSRSIVVITDGYVSFEKETFDVIRQNLYEANLFSVGIGSSVNRYLIDGMARAGSGEPLVITLREKEQIEAKAEKFRNLIQYPVLTQIKTEYKGFEVYDVEPLSLPDVFANRPILLYGKWKGEPKGELVLSGISGEKRFKTVLEVKNAKPDRNNAALRYLWARHKIAMLSDFNKVLHTDEHKKEITELGLKYNLLTNYTSFVAIDSEVRNTSDTSVTVKQPLPLPEGVSNYAVGGSRSAMSATSGAKYKSMNGGLLGGYGKTSGDMLGIGAAPLEEKSPQVTKAKKTLPMLALDSVVVLKGKEKPGVFKKILKQRLGYLRQCFKVSSQPSELKGYVRVKLKLNPAGRIISVKVLDTTIKENQVLNCLKSKLKRLRFAQTSMKEEPGEVVIRFSVQ
jgi:Ca-activated chloride channel family protein